MAICGAQGSLPKASAHYLFVPTMLPMVFVTAGALLVYNGSGAILHPVGISRMHLGSTHLHAYVACTLRALKSDPLKAKVEALFKQARDQVALVNAYASYARRAKLDMKKQLRNFIEQMNTINKLQDADMVDEETLRQYKRELKERIKDPIQGFSLCILFLSLKSPLMSRKVLLAWEVDCLCLGI